MNAKKNLIQLQEESAELMETWKPRVRFQIPSELEACRYLNFLHTLIVELVMKAEPGRAEWNEYNAVHFGDENGGEGGMGGSTSKVFISTTASCMGTTAFVRVRIMLDGKGL